MNPVAIPVIKTTQHVGTLVENQDLGSQSDRHRQRITANNATSEDDYSPLWHARNTTQQNAAAAMGLFQAAGTGLNGHTAGNLRHGRQQRQTAGRVRHGFIGDAGCPGCKQVPGLGRIRRQMQIGKQRLPWTQALPLLGLRLLDLDDQVAVTENLLTGNQLGASLPV